MARAMTRQLLVGALALGTALVLALDALIIIVECTSVGPTMTGGVGVWEWRSTGLPWPWLVGLAVGSSALLAALFSRAHPGRLFEVGLVSLAVTYAAWGWLTLSAP